MRRAIACLVAAVAMGGAALASAGPAAAAASLTVTNSVDTVVYTSNTHQFKYAFAAKSTGKTVAVTAYNRAMSTVAGCLPAGCRGDAVAMEVVFADSAAQVRADNLATNLARNCGTVAHPCVQLAGAYQWVVTGGPSSLAGTMQGALTNAQNGLRDLAAQQNGPSPLTLGQTQDRADAIAGGISSALDAALTPAATAQRAATAQTATPAGHYIMNRDVKTG